MIFSALASLVSILTPANPDRVLILGVPFTQDEKAIWSDCETWRAVWSTRGVSVGAIIYEPNVRTANQLAGAIGKLKKSMATVPSGTVWICVSGHGTVIESKPAINCQPHADAYEPVPWANVFKQLSLTKTWRATLLPDLCHNNLLVKVLPPGYSSISWDESPDNEACRVATHNYGVDGMRGVISWVASRSLNDELDLNQMSRLMTETCASERKKYGAPAYKFRVDIGSKVP